MIDNWIPLQELWDESLETNLESEVKSRVIGVKHQRGTCDYYFGVSLDAQILRTGDNLSKTLQDGHISASEGQAVSSLTVKTLEKMRSNDHFNLLWETVTHKANALEVSEPSLPRRRQRPSRCESGSATPEFVDNAQDYFHQIYFNAIDTVTACMKRRFDQPGHKIYDQVEQILVNAANGKLFEKNLDDVVDFYKDDLDKFQLETQLSLLLVQFGRENGKVSLEDVIKYLRNLTNAQKMFMSQVIIVMKLLLVAPVTNAVSERSCLALRRTKTWLRTTMTQKRLNNCMLLHVHKEKVDNLKIIDIANEFGCANESRLSTFGKFSEHDFQTCSDNCN